jgi:hypothetical protein
MYTIVLRSADMFVYFKCCVLQGFIQSGEVHIFGYARSNLSDDRLRERIRG